MSMIIFLPSLLPLTLAYSRLLSRFSYGPSHCPRRGYARRRRRPRRHGLPDPAQLGRPVSNAPLPDPFLWRLTDPAMHSDAPRRHVVPWATCNMPYAAPGGKEVGPDVGSLRSGGGGQPCLWFSREHARSSPSSSCLRGTHAA